MRLGPLLVLVCLAVAGLVIWFPQPGWSASPLFDPATMMPVSSVRAGMKGTCRTVFSGVDISEFNIEILGVLPKLREGTDAILVQILDGPVIAHDTGVFAGMSGSPVYIGGRLVGAIAFTWEFGKQPIAGVTPIESMLHAFDKEDSVGGTPAAAAPDHPRSTVTIAGHRITGVQVSEAVRQPTYSGIAPGDNAAALRRLL